MNRISYKLIDAARALDITKGTLVRLRNEGHVITYKIGLAEYVTDYALRDLQMRLEARDGSVLATINDKPAYEFLEAAKVLGVTPRKLEELRDDALISSYHDNAGDEWISRHAILDLQHRVAAGACLLDGESVRLEISFGGDSLP